MTGIAPAEPPWLGRRGQVHGQHIEVGPHAGSPRAVHALLELIGGERAQGPSLGQHLHAFVAVGIAHSLGERQCRRPVRLLID